MTNDLIVWLPICRTGRPFNLGDAVKTLEDVLDAVYRSMQCGGSQYDHPYMLMANGKIIVEKDLSDLAWQYGRFKSEKFDELYASCNAKAKALVPLYQEPEKER